jgi:hypothetical protein
MSDRQTFPARYGLLILPVVGIAIAAYSFSHRSAGKAAVPSYGNAVEWECRTSYRPDVSVFDTPKFAIALPSIGKDAAGDSSLTIVVSTPQKIKSEMSPGLPGFDIRYFRRVDTITLGARSFEILDGKTLRVSGKEIPLSGAKPYVTIDSSGKAISETTPPPWYEAASRAGFWSRRSLAEISLPVHALLPDSVNRGGVWPGRALYTPTLTAVNCDKFALAVQSAAPPKLAAFTTPFFSHLDIQFDGQGNLAAASNGVQENYSQGVSTFTLGKTTFRLIDHGRLLQTSSGPILLQERKKFITIAPNGTVTVETRKPAWFAAFDHAPADPPRDRYTVSAE